MLSKNAYLAKSSKASNVAKTIGVEKVFSALSIRQIFQFDALQAFRQLPFQTKTNHPYEYKRFLSNELQPLRLAQVRE